MDKESPLSFDHATYGPGVAAGPGCANCQAPISDRYWRLQSRLVCGGCQAQVAAAIDNARAKASLGKAALAGGAVALGCGIVYAIFVQVSGLQLALATIAIAYAIAKTVRKVSGGLGGRRFQILAVMLTYVASAMGYTGPVFQSFKDAPSAHHEAVADDPPATASTGAAAGRALPPKSSDDARRPVGAATIFLGVAFIFGIILAAPVLAATQAPIGLLIVAIGLFEAWKLSRGAVIALDGPYELSRGDAQAT